MVEDAGPAITAGLAIAGAWIATQSRAIGKAISDAFSGSKAKTPDAAVYHRLKSPTQSPEDARMQTTSGELWGKGYRDQGFPSVQAYTGPLPPGRRGIEFTTPVPAAKNTPPGKATWYPGTPGVRVEDGYAKVPILVAKTGKHPRNDHF